MSHADDWVMLNLSDGPIWERAFFVHPLVLIGTLEANGNPDFAPKHMVTPLCLSDVAAIEALDAMLARI